MSNRDAIAREIVHQAARVQEGRDREESGRDLRRTAHRALKAKVVLGYEYGVPAVLLAEWAGCTNKTVLAWVAEAETRGSEEAE